MFRGSFAGVELKKEEAYMLKIRAARIAERTSSFAPAESSHQSNFFKMKKPQEDLGVLSAPLAEGSSNLFS